MEVVEASLPAENLLRALGSWKPSSGVANPEKWESCILGVCSENKTSRRKTSGCPCPTGGLDAPHPH